MNDNIAIYIRNESEDNIKKLINYLKKGNFRFSITTSMSYYSYIVVDIKNKLARGTIFNDFEPMGNYYCSDNAQYLVDDLMVIDEFLKMEFKKKLIKNKKKKWKQ